MTDEDKEVLFEPQEGIQVEDPGASLLFEDKKDKFSELESLFKKEKTD